MIKKNTLLEVVDNSGIRYAKCIHHYFGFKKLTSYTAHFIKASVRKRHYDSKWVKAKRIYAMKKGKKLKGYIIRTRFKVAKPDSSTFYFDENTILTLKKRLSSKGKYSYGPFSYHTRRKKVLDSFAGLL